MESERGESFTLEEESLNETAKLCWGDYFILKDSIEVNESLRALRLKLLEHKRTINKDLPNILNNLPNQYRTIPKHLQYKLSDAITCLQNGFKEAVIWENVYEEVLPFTTLNTLKAGCYAAKYFIQPNGSFNDLLWAKKFILDEGQDLIRKFELACLYCFEENIIHLWDNMKKKNKLPCEGNLSEIKEKYNCFVWFWANKIENGITDITTGKAARFYVRALQESLEKGYEYAGRYFFARLSVGKKEKFLRNFNFDLLIGEALQGHSGVVNFFYGLLTKVQRTALILSGKGENIYSCLIESIHYEQILNDIFNYPPNEKFHGGLLSCLTFTMREMVMLSHKRVFVEIWNYLPLSEQRSVLEEEFCIIINLVKAQSIELLKMVLSTLPREDKERMLLHDWLRAGISALHEFTKSGNFDEMLSYLLLLVLDKRGNAEFKPDFIDRFKKSERYRNWTEKTISEKEKKEVIKILDNVKGTLKALDKLIEHVIKYRQYEISTKKCPT